MRTRQMTKPPHAYNFTTLVKELLSCAAVCDGKNSAVMSLMFQDKVIKKGMPLTNITSATNVTKWWST